MSSHFFLYYQLSQWLLSPTAILFHRKFIPLRSAAPLIWLALWQLFNAQRPIWGFPSSLWGWDGYTKITQGTVGIILSQYVGGSIKPYFRVVQSCILASPIWENLGILPTHFLQVLNHTRAPTGEARRIFLPQRFLEMSLKTFSPTLSTAPHSGLIR